MNNERPILLSVYEQIAEMRNKAIARGIKIECETCVFNRCACVPCNYCGGEASNFKDWQPKDPMELVCALNKLDRNIKTNLL